MARLLFLQFGLTLCLVVVAMLEVGTALDNSQTTFGTSRSPSWTVSISDTWDVLGPFPIQAREQQYLSPSYPIDASQPIDFHKSWPSSLADNGAVTWRRAQSNSGHLTLTYPDIRWSALRSTEGWAALQHHSVLRTTITLYPGPTIDTQKEYAPSLLIELSQGSFFTILPQTEGHNIVPAWHSGNIYAVNSSPQSSIQLPSKPSLLSPTTYDLFISGDYEIRLFGDPLVSNSTVPKLQLDISVALQDSTESLKVIDSHSIVPDFVDGWAFGGVIGIEIQALDDWWEITSGRSEEDNLELVLPPSFLHPLVIAPSQTRIIPLRIRQSKPISKTTRTISVKLNASGSSGSIEISTSLDIRHNDHWHSRNTQSLIATYVHANFMATAFAVKPPTDTKSTGTNSTVPPILALHGAGVEIFDNNFWIDALPSQKYSWTIVPSGRTSWGLDWHGPSAIDAWECLEAFSEILQFQTEWHPYSYHKGSRVILVGHSNGGQGAWYIASRYPDRVLAVIPAAGYIKSQSYVPLTMSRGAHFVDPTLRAILESSLTADDNDLFVRNLVDTPILAIHGGNDENVPVWHTRELVSVLKSWRPDANITYQEDAGQPHWYSNLFDNNIVQSFIEKYLQDERPSLAGHSFTLTVVSPSEAGSMHGFKIVNTLKPGRLARLTVQQKSTSVEITTTNVLHFSVERSSPFWPSQGVFIVDDTQLITEGLPDSILFSINDKKWEIIKQPWTVPIRPSGRMSAILSSSAPLNIVISNKTNTRELSIALRIAHDLYLYHKLDSRILEAHTSSKEIEQSTLQGNLIVIGTGVNNLLVKNLLEKQQTPFDLRDNRLFLNDDQISDHHTAIFLHPHPLRPTGLSLIIYPGSHDLDANLERGRKLFPIRTGVPIPDWVILDETVDSISLGGIRGAGVWGNNWTWNEAMSYF
ncbi:hypothetical protein C8Q75DRAFT_34633 [Abortiporus biennis]|nr:hypothetical protein C8Q75DRAFT_34633 [Abortiporus biennis]